MRGAGKNVGRSAVHHVLRGLRGALLAGMVWGTAAQAAEPLRIGVLAPEGAEEAGADWSALAGHLQRRLPERAVRIQTHDLAGLRAAIAGGAVDFFIANSGFYVEMEFAYGAARVATLESAEALSPDKALASAVIVRADRHDLKSLGDLRGRRLMAVADTAFGGYQVAWREMLRIGLDPRSDVAELRFSGYPLQKIVHAVMHGDVDAGIVRACLLERLEQRGLLAPGALRVLDAKSGDGFPCQRSTPLYPDWPFAALRGTDHALSKRVATALLTMPPGARGTMWTVPTDYQSVHELFRELEIGPYSYLAERPLEQWLRRNWWLAAVVLLGLVGWAVHTVRVKVLVTRRTRELREALAARDRAEADARTRDRQLDHLARLGILGEMASMLAHELAQPLAAIGNFGRGLCRRIEGGAADSERLMDGAQAIVVQAERAAQVIDRIRAFSRKRAVEHVPVALDALVKETVSLFSAMVVCPPVIDVVCDPGGDSPLPSLWVEGDRLQLQQVFLNLLKNSYDAVRDMHVERQRITVRLASADGRVRAAFSDAGPVLPPGTAERLFEPFFTTKADGVGLGLAICQRTIEAHRGGIAAHPLPGGGLEVEIFLPSYCA